MSEEDLSFVNPISEDTSSDPVLDLKTGIYNLFVNLVNIQILSHGPVQAVQNSIDFLQEIIYNFEQSITDKE